MIKKIKFLIFAPICLLIACQSHFGVDADLGSSVNAAIKNQTINPQAANIAPEEVRGMDGVSARTSIDSYQNSFIRRSPALGVQPSGQSNLNGASGSTGSGGSYMSTPLQ